MSQPFKNYSINAKTKVCHIYNIKHMKHYRFVTMVSQLSNTWAY